MPFATELGSGCVGRSAYAANGAELLVDFLRVRRVCGRFRRPILHLTF